MLFYSSMLSIVTNEPTLIIKLVLLKICCALLKETRALKGSHFENKIFSLLLQHARITFAEADFAYVGLLYVKKISKH